MITWHLDLDIRSQLDSREYFEVSQPYRPIFDGTYRMIWDLASCITSLYFILQFLAYVQPYRNVNNPSDKLAARLAYRHTHYHARPIKHSFPEISLVAGAQNRQTSDVWHETRRGAFLS